MTPVDREQQARFLRQVQPAAASVCPQYGLDPKLCVTQAAEASSCGRFTLGYNWWNLRGRGDAGYYTTVCPVRTTDGSGGGWLGQEAQIAKFSSPFAAVRAWCEAQRREQGGHACTV